MLGTILLSPLHEKQHEIRPRLKDQWNHQDGWECGHNGRFSQFSWESRVQLTELATQRSCTRCLVFLVNSRTFWSSYETRRSVFSYQFNLHFLLLSFISQVRTRILMLLTSSSRSGDVAVSYSHNTCMTFHRVNNWEIVWSVVMHLCNSLNWRAFLNEFRPSHK